MTDAQQREAARQFYYKWNGKGREDEDARSYWIDILQNIFGVENVTDRVQFEKKVKSPEGTKRIDVYIPETRVLIEQKSLGIALEKPQYGHGGKTPYDQAKEYDNYVTVDEKANWIITSNFEEIWIYDCHQALPEPVILKLSDLQTKYHRLDFLIKPNDPGPGGDNDLSFKAGDLVGKLYDCFLKQYKYKEDPETLKSLNKLCVRIVFCLYAEDAGVFGKKSMFHDYMKQFDAQHARKGLRDLFRVLNQEPNKREKYLADDDPILAAFPYVNGGLFADDDIEIPPFTDEIMDLILRKASDDFDWSGISPTIFGALFESTLNPETRKSGGMHYTSIENIHKVIDPLFLDDLKAELREIKKDPVLKSRKVKLQAYQNKLATLEFLDPAAGSGNFLTESYICIRRLENEALRELSQQIVMGGVTNPVKVSIAQFYGIEINDFAVTVARTALWIAESQMLKETEDIVNSDLDFLPLRTQANIVEANALRIDWNDVVPKERLFKICGNPPFYGAMNIKDKRNEMVEVFGNVPFVGELDYVCAWYKKALEYTQDTTIESAFVSTNSICQGQQAINLWRLLFAEGLVINYAYQTFIWDSEATDKAHVHCVIVGFSHHEKKSKFLFHDDQKLPVEYINQYLTTGKIGFLNSRPKPLDDVPPMKFGSMPRDGGGFIISEEERRTLVQNEPLSEKWVRMYLGAEEFLKKKKRYCLWLLGANPAEISKCPTVKQRVDRVRAFRLASKAASTRKFAETPTLFCQIAQPSTGSYIAVPETSSERRRYIPLGFLSADVIASNLLFLIPNASLFHFGVLESNVHMAWMRTVCGRLKSDYRYSKDIVYNNFPWPEPTEEQKARIEQTAQAILDARALYPEASLADLYDPLTMPPELLKAHQANDKAVMQAYGMPIKDTDEASCVAWLMKLYREKVDQS